MDERHDKQDQLSGAVQPAFHVQGRPMHISPLLNYVYAQLREFLNVGNSV